MKKLVSSVRDFGLLRATALAAATVISFEAESDLAKLAGVTTSVSYAMPVAIDCLMIAALRSRRPFAVACAALLMGSANAGSHLLSPDTDGVHKGIIAAVSVIPVVVLMLLELLVPAVSEKRPAEVARPAPFHPVSWLNAETLASDLAVTCVVPETVPVTREEELIVPEPERESEPETEETPDVPPETARMSKERAEEVALQGYVNSETLRAVAQATGWSRSTINRWYDQWDKEGVKRLVAA